MEKQIKEFQTHLQNELERIERMDSGSSKEKCAQLLWRLYQQRLDDFKHERLIHLIVMLFFVATTGVVLIIAMSMPLLELLPGVHVSILSTIGCFAVALILIIVDIFYVKHYFFLENSIQRLYQNEERIIKCISE